MAEGWFTEPRTAGRHPLLLALAGLLGVVAIILLMRWGGAFAPSIPPIAIITSAPTVPALPTRAAPLPRAATAAPSFDIVRVDRSGHAVMAGRAVPGSEVTVTAGGQVIGTTTTDAEGQWVLVPNASLAAGGHALTLSAHLPDGKTLAGPERVVVVVPHPGAGLPVALLSGPAAPRLIEAPPATGGAAAVGLDLLRYGQRGATQLSGRAPPHADLRIYLDNHPVGEVRTDDTGHWSLSLRQPLAPGKHQLRLDDISPAGRVLARVAVPFERSAEPLPPLAAGQVVVVQPGQCLWLIAEEIYGAGVRYTLIFQANRDQIRNPALIYPGQVLTLPTRTPGFAPRGHG